MNTQSSPLLITVVFSFLLAACGGSPSSFDEDGLEPVTIDPIESESGEVTIGGSLSDEELASLPQIDIPIRKFSDPGAVVTLNADVTPQDDANIIATLWVQTSGPAVDIANDTRLNTSTVLPVVDEESLLTFRLIAQDDQGRVNSATTTIVIQDVNNPLQVVGGVADEGDASFSVTIKIDEARTTDTSVEYLTFDGTATSALDYADTQGSVVIPAGETQVDVDVDLTAGDLYLDAESFFFQASTLRDDGTRSRSLGTVLIRTANPAPLLETPELEDLPTQVFLANTSVDNVLFNNMNDNGDRILECSSDLTLPAGLRLETTELGSSCVITGTPLTASEETEYEIKAINPVGESTAKISIEVQADDNNIQAPELSGDVSPNPLVLNEEISPIVAFNNGGQQDLVCSADALPAGLSVEVAVVTEDIFDGDANVTQITCQIVGTPTEIVTETEYAITASNIAGESVWPILLSVEELIEPVEAPNLADETLSLNFTINQAIPTTTLENTGGEILACDWSNDAPVQVGLILELVDSECLISGTPNAVAFTDTSITAVNENGEDTVAIELTITSGVQAPILDNPAVVANFTVGEFGWFEVLPGYGNGLQTQDAIIWNCRELDSLPEGIFVDSFHDGEVSVGCVLSGTATAVAAAADYNIQVFGENIINGESTGEYFATEAVINFAVSEAAPPVEAPAFSAESLSFTLNQNTAMNPVTLENAGGALASCGVQGDADFWPGLNLSLLEGACVINGTPTEATGDAGLTVNIFGTNESGTDTIAVSIVVEPETLLLVVDTPPNFTLSTGTFFSYTFSTSGAAFDSCSSPSALPAGLELSTFLLEDDIPECSLAGIPTVASANQTYEVVFSVDEGVSLATTSFDIVVEQAGQAPIISAPAASASFTENLTITDIVFPNTGGDISACSTSAALPPGLTFGLLTQETGVTTCVLTGTPTVPLANTEYTLSFESTFAPVELAFSIEVQAELLTPALSDLAAQNFRVSEAAIDALVFDNTGGGSLTSCASVPDINTVTPLTLSISADASSCVISGAPITAVEEQTYIVTASNATGSDTASVSFAIESAPIINAPVTSANFTENLEFDPIVFTNSGGEVSACSVLPALPSGITFDLFTQESGISTCVLGGTPLEASDSTALHTQL